MIHAGLAAIFCGLVLLFRGPAWLTLWPAVFYVSREFAQAEYRYILLFCNGSFADMPTFAGFSPLVWNQKSLFDWLFPSLVSFIFYYLCTKHIKKTQK